jgi:gliding motility-associated-like protein
MVSHQKSDQMKKLIILCIVLFTLLAGRLPGQQVSTVAGVLETPGFNDGTALSARFFNPHGIATDSFGNVYIADRFNHTIRKLTPAGQVSTIAGLAGQQGDADGPGNEARFFEPWGICSAADGSLYVADTRNNKIRRISPEGMVSTFAGSGSFGTSDGFQQSATFGNPTGIELGPLGDIYVADHLTHIIRKISPDGWVSTLAGTPYIPGSLDGQGNLAQFWRPYGLTVDPEGNVIVADEWNHLIRKVSPDGEVSTIAGTGEVGVNDGVSASARFNYPWDVSVSPSGDIYVADGYNYLIRKITPAQEVIALAGTAQVSGGNDGEGQEASFSGATALAYCAFSNTIYIADAYNHLIRQMSIEGGVQLNLIKQDGQSSYCAGDSISISAVPGNLGYYRFLLNGEIVQEGENPNLMLSGLGEGSYQLGCSAVVEGENITSPLLGFQIVPAPMPEIVVVGSPEIFPGDTVSLFVTGAGSFVWSTGETGLSISITEAGVYTVTATNPAGCIGQSEPVIIEEAELTESPEIFVDGPTTLCPGETSILFTNANENIQWFRDGWAIAGATAPEMAVSLPGFYQVQFRQDDGIHIFSDVQEIQLTTLPYFSIDEAPISAATDEPISFSASGEAGLGYEWTFSGPVSYVLDGTTFSHSFQEAGYYDLAVVATSDFGCMDTLYIDDYVNITSPENMQDNPNNPTANPVDTIQLMDHFIPTAFSPNGDGLNDVFRPIGDVWDGYGIQVYDQWGKMLFEGFLPESGWDGSSGGLETPAGTYVYMLIPGNADSARADVIAGHVSLIR